MNSRFLSIRSTCSLAAILAFVNTMPGAYATGLTLSQTPLFLNEGVAPNLLITLDDSGSMERAYTPDNIASPTNSRRFHSAYYNPMYYNPAVNYAAPKKVVFNAGTGITTLTDYPTSYTAAFLNGFRPTLGSVNLSTNFKASVTYTQGSAAVGTQANNPDDFPSTPTNQRSGGVAAYYYTRNNTLANCTATDLEDEDCYQRVFIGTTAAERQNFANWYSFYRTRALATAASANVAFSSLSENTRVTWQMLNSCSGLASGTCAGQSGTSYSNRLRNFANSHKQTFFNWLADTPSSGGTPLLDATVRVGTFLSKTGVEGPNAFSLGTTIAPEYACRANYHVLMTDGAWNQSPTPTIAGDSDSTALASLPDSNSYTPRAPFRDSAANTLSDLAFHYWAKDARTDIPNGLKPFTPFLNANATTQYWDPRNDPATWQHMVTYTLGLGLTRGLTNPAWTGSTYTGGYNGLLAGTTPWPSPTNNGPQNVYELWHSALNSRGEFFSVESPQDMVAAFKSILGRIASRDSSAAAVSVESAISRSDNEAYYARFSSANWSGELIKYDITASGSLTYAWNARDLLEVKNPSSRNIKFNAGAGVGLRDFLWGNLSSAQQALLNKTAAGTTDTLGSDRLNYLRGDQSLEGTTGVQFRPRTFVLGDIIYSSPVVVGAPDRLTNLMDTASGSSSTGANSYGAFKAAQASRAKRIYVGSNDGMLHGFNDSGEEVFAYIPTAVFDRLNLLTDRGYNTNHQSYVDGTPVVGDVFQNGRWRTILVGTLRGGGRAAFALDITDPNNISVLWEFSSANDTDLGFTFSKPIITRMHNGAWNVILSNGYNSTNDKAALFILDAVTGTVTKKLLPNAGAIVNGLSAPKTVDINGDLITDYVYAGDLGGNLWRFDLFNTSNPYVSEAFPGAPFTPTSTGVNPNIWRVSFGDHPLYTATNGTPQAITTSPTLIRHPLGTGFIVSVGTGKYIENGDSVANTTRAMTVYGIWDQQTLGETASSTPALTRSNLVQQTMGDGQSQTFSDTVGAVTTSLTRDVRLLSRNPIEWYTGGNPSAGVSKYGWYLNLQENSTLQGELVAVDSTARANVLIVSTLIPNADPCTSGVTRWVNAIDGITGGATTFHVFDLSGNRTVSANDGVGTNGNTVVSSVKIPGYGSPTIVGTTALINADDGIKPLELTFGPYASKRQSWRVLGE